MVLPSLTLAVTESVVLLPEVSSAPSGWEVMTGLVPLATPVLATTRPLGSRSVVVPLALEPMTEMRAPAE